MGATMKLPAFFRRNQNVGRIQPLKEVEEKSCGIIVYLNRQGTREYLLLHYPGGHWDFPKGHVEPEDADDLATAQRELTEETGITDLSMDPTYETVMYYEFNRGRKEKVKKTVVYFLAKTNGNRIQLSHEHKGFQWLPYEHALKRLTFENARQLLRRAESHLQA